MSNDIASTHGHTTLQPQSHQREGLAVTIPKKHLFMVDYGSRSQQSVCCAGCWQTGLSFEVLFWLVAGEQLFLLLKMFPGEYASTPSHLLSGKS